MKERPHKKLSKAYCGATSVDKAFHINLRISQSECLGLISWRTGNNKRNS